MVGGGAGGEAGLEPGVLDDTGMIRARRAPGLATGWLLVQRSLETAPAPLRRHVVTRLFSPFSWEVASSPGTLCTKPAKEGAELVAGDRFNEVIE